MNDASERGAPEGASGGVSAAFLPQPLYHPLVAVLLALAIVVAAIVAATAVAVTLRGTAATGGALSSGTSLLAAAIASQVVFGLGAIAVVGLRAPLWASFQLGRPPFGWRDYGAAIGGLIGMATSIQMFRAVVLGHDVLADLLQLMPLFEISLWPVSFVVIVVLAPVAEELLFRGFLLPALARTFLGFWGAAIASSGLWTLLHAYSLPAMVLVFLMGLMLSWMFARTGSLRVPIAAHVANNLLAAVSLLVLSA